MDVHYQGILHLRERQRLPSPCSMVAVPSHGLESGPARCGRALLLSRLLAEALSQGTPGQAGAGQGEPDRTPAAAKRSRMEASGESLSRVNEKGRPDRAALGGIEMRAVRPLPSPVPGTAQPRGPVRRSVRGTRTGAAGSPVRRSCRAPWRDLRSPRHLPG